MLKSLKFLNLVIFSLTAAEVQAESLNGTRRVLLHSYGQQGLSEGLNDLYLQDTAPGLEAKVNALFNRLDRRIEVDETTPSPLSLLQRNIRTNKYSFRIDGYPICQMQVKAHESIHGAVTIMGDMPDIAVERSFENSDWSAVNLAFGLVQDTRHDHNIIERLKLKSQSQCIWLDRGIPVPVWKLKVQAGKLNYIAYADESEVYQFQNGFFHVDGIARIYPNNPLDSALEEFTVRNLQPDTDGIVLVENDKFITLLDTDVYTYYQAVSSESSAAPYLFAPATTDDAFAEVSLFTNANRALDWFEARGYANFGDSPIRIVVHAEFAGGDTNNALYQPGSDFSTIFVGNGDGDILQNLALDYDVVAHEFGHHVVYHSITNIQQESLVLHEGLADFFTFAKTGDACLGESICPATSGICAIANQCLRTAENDYSYTDPDLPPEAHLQSQFISGMLWDLIEVDGIPRDDLASMMLKAVDLFVSNSGFEHLVLALLMVDESDNQGTNCDTIYNRAVARGLSAKISSFDCSTISSLVESNGGTLNDVTGGGSGSGGTQTVSRESTSSSKNWCGAIGISDRNQGTASIVFLLALPLLIQIRRWM